MVTYLTQNMMHVRFYHQWKLWINTSKPWRAEPDDKKLQMNGEGLTGNIRVMSSPLGFNNSSILLAQANLVRGSIAQKNLQISITKMISSVTDYIVNQR